MKEQRKNRRRKKKETICNETRAVRRDYGIEMREEERWHGRERMKEEASLKVLWSELREGVRTIFF